MRLRLPLLTCVAVLAWASVAHADTYCTGTPPLSANCDHSGYLTLQPALDAARLRVGDDTIKLDPSITYEQNDLDTGFFGADKLTIESLDPDQRPTLERASGNSAKVLFAKGNLTIRNVDLYIGAGTNSNTGIYTQSGNLTLQDVTISVEPSATAAVGVQLSDNYNYDFSRVHVNGGQIAINQSYGNLNMERTLVNGAANGFYMASGGSTATPTAHIWQSSFLGPGTAGTGVTAANAVAAGAANLYMRDTLIINYATHGLSREPTASHPVNITTNYVAVPPGAVNNPAGNGTYTSANPMNAIPQLDSFLLGEGIPFPQPGGNLVDVDPTTALQTGDGENDPTDFDGNFRVQNGARDIGVYEVAAAPAISAVSASGSTTGRIAATITDNGAETAWGIVIGTTVGTYDSVADGELAPSAGPLQIAGAVAGPTPGATYHYVIYAENNHDFVQTGDRTFTAALPPSGVVQPIAALSKVKLSPSKVRRGKKATASYSLTLPATVSFTATSKKRPKKGKTAKAVKLGSQIGKAGTNRYTFSTKKLKKGKYTVAATPPGGKAVSATLTVK